MIAKVTSAITLVCLSAIFVSAAGQPDGVFFAISSPNKAVGLSLISLFALALWLSSKANLKWRNIRLLLGSLGLILLFAAVGTLIMNNSITSYLYQYFELLDILAVAELGVILSLIAFDVSASATKKARQPISIPSHIKLPAPKLRNALPDYNFWSMLLYYQLIRSYLIKPQQRIKIV